VLKIMYNNPLGRSPAYSYYCELRNSGYGIYIGGLFVGCILYADDILLLSSSCYGLQSMLNVCVEFGSRWDILFNPAKTQCVTFGGNSSK